MAPTLPPFVELTVHETLLSGKSLRSAENCRCAPAETETPVGLTISPLPTVTVATDVLEVTVVVFVVSLGNSGVSAVMLTCPLLVVGTIPGAVYTPTSLSVPEDTIVPTAVLPPETPFTNQVTVVGVVVEVLERFRVAVN